MLADIVVKQLGYLWVDDVMADIVQSQIKEGEAVLKRLSPDFDPETRADDRALIVEYVRYARANSRDDFRENYRKELLALSDRGRIARHADKDNED